MNVQVNKLLAKAIVWLAAEIILNLLGLDNLADYSEFIYEQDIVMLSNLGQPVIIMPPF